MTRLFLINFLVGVEFPEFWRFASIFAFTKILNFFDRILRFLNIKSFFLPDRIIIDYLFKIKVFIIRIKEFFSIKKINIITSLIDLIEIGIII